MVALILPENLIATMQLKVLANWLYGIQVFLSMYPDEDNRFMVVQNNNFRTVCLPMSNCGIGQFINLANYVAGVLHLKIGCSHC